VKLLHFTGDSPSMPEEHLQNSHGTWLTTTMFNQIITGMVHVFKSDTCLRKPLVLLYRFSITDAAPEDTNAAPKDW